MEKRLEEKLAKKLQISQAEANRRVNDFKQLLIECIAEDKTFRLRGVGTWTTSLRKQRKGRNPATGESIIIPEAWQVKFKPHKRLLELVTEVNDMPF